MSVGIKAELSNEQDKHRELCEIMNTLEADLIDGIEGELSCESEVDCLQIELADADDDAENSWRTLAVGMNLCLFVSMYRARA